ncbi:MAG: amidase [Anaerolineales bacterium]|nr:amidase [Anaerolineales bacterium]
MNRLTSLSIHEISALISKREISPVEITSACLERITSIEPKINGFITLTGDIALEQAKVAEKEILSGEHRSPLHGVPIAVKDLFETQGIRTTAGSFFLRDYIPEGDCTVVEKLRRNGTILLGKLNMHEWALGVTNENPHYGDCHNPWDTSRIPGGSSGGSAAALAGEMCFGALGSDTGGSIRIPSALCGVVGLKPTFGLVSKRGVIPLSWNLDHVGPMARCVKDVAVLLNVIAGYDSQDPYSIDLPQEDYLTGIEESIVGWRIATPIDKFFHKADTEVLNAFRGTIKVFEDLGANITEVRFPQARQISRSNGLMTMSDAAAFHKERVDNHPDMFGKDVLSRLRSGAAFTSTEYILARHTQTLGQRWFRDFFQKYDLLITPTTPIVAPFLRSTSAIERAKQLTRFTGIYNLLGLPALSLPCGFSPSGMPIGLQIIAPWWGEARILRVAYAYEQATNWHNRYPSLKNKK